LCVITLQVLYDLGVVSTKEPFRRLVSQGMILGEVEYTYAVGADGKEAREDDPHATVVKVRHCMHCQTSGFAQILGLAVRLLFICSISELFHRTFAKVVARVGKKSDVYLWDALVGVWILFCALAADRARTAQ
jgi:leucyl-tRNA synthetase